MTNGLTTLDTGAIAIYLALMAGIGGVMGLYVKNVKEYFAGGNAVPWHLGAISNYMTMMSTFVFVAHAGIAYKDGLVAIVILWSAVPATLFGTAFLAARWRRAGLMTPVEYLEQRYDASVRQIVSWGGVVFRVLDNMVRLYALGVFVAGTMGCSLGTAVAVSGGIVIVYTMIGGLWAVVVTDAVQCATLLMITSVMVPLALDAVGGFGAQTEALPQHFTWTNGPKGSFGFLLVYFVMVTIKYNGNWAFIQRFYCSENEREARKMGLMSTVLYLVCPVIFLLPAIAAAVLVPGLANPEEAYVSVCKRLLPSGAMGLMIAAMLAATMSTLSAEYNVTAGVLTRDIYRRLLRPRAGNREQMAVARLATVVLGIAIICGATQVPRFGGAFEVNKTLMGLIGVPLVVPLVFGILFRRPKPWGAVASIACGIAAGFAFQRMPGLAWEAATFWQMLVCLCVLFLSAPGESRCAAYRERVSAFFARLSRPVCEEDGAADTEARPPAERSCEGGTARAAKPRGHRPIMVLFAVSLGLSGCLFIAVGLFNAGLRSGQYTLAAGLICCAVAAGIGRKVAGRP
jgi:SSS family transporter